MAETKESSKQKVKSKKNEDQEPKEKQVRHAEVVAEAVPVEAVPEVKIEVEKVTAKASKQKRSVKLIKQPLGTINNLNQPLSPPGLSQRGQANATKRL
jgi:hypothetical protein